MREAQRAHARNHRPVIAVAWPKPDYLKSLERAGAEPRVLRPHDDPLPASLEACDGVLLTGGADVDPARYGELERHVTVDVDGERDAYEFELTQHALDRDMPLLAICRGVQLLNVVAGGTLVQDLPTSRPASLPHRRPKPSRVKRARAHDVSVVSGTRLAGLLAARTTPDGHVAVNSRHHQAVDRVAPGFLVSATAEDGVIEAIERATAGFCVGVQWHPENYWRTGEFAELFEGLVTAAAQRARDRIS